MGLLEQIFTSKSYYLCIKKVFLFHCILSFLITEILNVIWSEEVEMEDRGSELFCWTVAVVCSLVFSVRDQTSSHFYFISDTCILSIMTLLKRWMLKFDKKFWPTINSQEKWTLLRNVRYDYFAKFILLPIFLVFLSISFILRFNKYEWIIHWIHLSKPSG